MRRCVGVGMLGTIAWQPDRESIVTSFVHWSRSAGLAGSGEVTVTVRSDGSRLWFRSLSVVAGSCRMPLSSRFRSSRLEPKGVGPGAGVFGGDLHPKP